MSLQSPLYEKQEALGATFTDFSGWKMPLHYGSIIKEHLAVRESVGLFDISHMGAVFVSGIGASAWLDQCLASPVSSLAPKEAQYSFLLNASGGVIDDLLVYHLTEGVYLIVPNASGVSAVVAHLMERLPDADVKLEDRSRSVVSLALQGPHAEALLQSVFPSCRLDDLKKNQLVVVEQANDSIVIARTGYTGSDGFELFTSIEVGQPLWDRLLNSQSGMTPQVCGLGSRDTLRIEAGYPLYGNELSSSISPVQAGLGFFLKPSVKQDLRTSFGASSARIVFYKVLEKAPPPRSGYTIFEGDTEIGLVTSGCLAPSLGSGIGFARVDRNITLNSEEKYTILIRNKKYPLMFTKRGII
ncbi:MAG: glycine cleavage system aminomethyltransferase GcvT [Puniceicoccaceae bacterium]|nr:MAG: glycine cleavage system aminomethyltransferase GcvT [Puniceicoccaceae bacterium]